MSARGRIRLWWYRMTGAWAVRGELARWGNIPARAVAVLPFGLVVIRPTAWKQRATSSNTREEPNEPHD